MHNTVYVCSIGVTLLVILLVSFCLNNNTAFMTCCMLAQQTEYYELYKLCIIRSS